MFKKTLHKVTGGLTGYEPRIIISVGINAYSKKEALEEAEKMAKVIEIKLGEYLDRTPNKIEIKF